MTSKLSSLKDAPNSSTAEEEASFYACSGFQFYFFCTALEKHALEKTLQMERVTIPAFSVLIETAICNMRGPDGKEAPFFAIMLTFFRLMYLTNAAMSFAYGTSFPLRLMPPLQPMMMMMKIMV